MSELNEIKDPRVKFAMRTLPLGSGDMILPFICASLTYIIFVGILTPIMIAYHTSDVMCIGIKFGIWLYSSYITHLLSAIISVILSYIAIKTKVLEISKYLHPLLNIRFILNLIEIGNICWGIYEIFIDNNKSCLKQDRNLNTLAQFYVIYNIVVILITYVVLLCISTSKDNDNDTYNMDASDKCSNILKKCCCLCFYDERNSTKVDRAFNEMGQLLTMIRQGNPHSKIKLTPSDIICGLHLLKMLQKHYYLFDWKLYNPLIRDDYKHKFNNGKELNDEYMVQKMLYSGKQPILDSDELKQFNDAQYYIVHANAAYGIALYTMTKPCAICCALPCGLPGGITNRDTVLYRNDGCCNNCNSLDNSTLKVFIQRTGINSEDILCAHQIKALYKVSFFCGN